MKKWSKAYYLTIAFQDIISINDIKINTGLSLSNQNDSFATTNLLCLLQNRLKLEIDIAKNELLLNEKEYNERLNRLLIVQSEKKLNPNLLEEYNKDIQIEDNFSETGSVISAGVSHDSHKSNKSSKSKKSNATKLTKKAQNKLSKRTVKQGSPLEEDYLLIILQEIHDNLISNEYEIQINDFCIVLSYLDLIDDSKEITIKYQTFKEKIIKAFPMFNVYQQEFLNKYPDAKNLFSGINLSKPTTLSITNSITKK